MKPLPPIAALLVLLAPSPLAQRSLRQGEPALAPDPSLWNTGLAVRFGEVGSAAGLHAYLIYESDQGRDLNGDGDTLDRVPHLVDARAHTVQPVPRAYGQTGHPFSIVFGDYLALPVPEAEQGRDLTGDGDLADVALSIVEARTGLVRDLGIACESFFGAANVLSVRGPLGNYDQIGTLAVYDAPRDRLRPLGRAGDGRVTASGLAVQWVDERATALDLNGDGDQSDSVVSLYEAASDTLTNTGLAVRASSSPSSGEEPVALQRGTLLVPVYENAQRVDLNGDGDQVDEILHEYDLAGRFVRNTGLDGDGMIPARALARSVEAAVYFIVSEDGRDQNGDGDGFDVSWYSRTSDGRIAPFPGALRDFFEFDLTHHGERFAAGYLDGTTHVLDLHTGVAQDLKNPTYIDLPAFASSTLLPALFSEDLAGQDVDGDGRRDSFILHVHDLVRGTSATLLRGVDIDFALAFFPRLAVDGGLVAWACPELPGRDGNGDGDTTDAIVWLYRIDPVRGGRTRWIDTGTTIRARRPGEFAYFPRVGEPWVVWPVVESEESRDLDGDGTLDDEVLAVFHAPSRTLSFHAGATLNDLGRGRLRLALAESRHGDLNGDGDVLDSVLHFVSEP